MIKLNLNVYLTDICCVYALLFVVRIGLSIRSSSPKELSLSNLKNLLRYMRINLVNYKMKSVVQILYNTFLLHKFSCFAFKYKVVVTTEAVCRSESVEVRECGLAA